MLVIGFAAGWVALDRVRAVEVVAGFIRTDGAAQVARLGFSFAALAPVAARGSALAFGIAGAIEVSLATASTWERRLEWWGAATVLAAWDRLAIWACIAFALALLALAARRSQPQRRTMPAVDSGTIPASSSPQSRDRIV